MSLNRYSNFAFLFATLLLLCSCVLTPLPHTTFADPSSTLHLYLQPMPQEAHQLSLTLASLNARTIDGRDIPLLDGEWVLNPAESIGSQIKLLQKKLPVGGYAGLSIELAAATLKTEEGPIDLLIEKTTQLIKQDFLIEPAQAQTLFLTLNPERLITEGYLLSARFSVWKAQMPLPNLKGFVSQPLNGTLALFEKKSPTIYSVIAVGRGPSGMALDQDRRLVYLALTDENSLTVVDLIRDKVQRKIRLHTAARPTELALSADGKNLLSVNTGTNSVSILSTDSLIERRRLFFSSTPAKVFTGVDKRWAYVSLPDVNALALIDLDRAAVTATINLPDTVLDGATDVTGREIYLLTANSANLLVVDAMRLKEIGRVYIGYGASCLTVDRNGLVYVGMKTGEVAVVDPQVGFPIDNFKVGQEVVDLAVDREENTLFVVTGDEPVLEKFDLVSKRKMATLELGARSFAVNVMGQR